MGCYPLGEIVSNALRKYKGRRRRLRAEREYYYTSPPTYTFARSVATHSTEIPGMMIPPGMKIPPGMMMPPETSQIPTIPKHHPETVITPSPHAEIAQSKETARVWFGPGPEPNEASPHPGQPEQAKVRFASEPDPQGPVPKSSMRKGSNRVRFAAQPDPPETVPNNPNQQEQSQVRYGPGGSTPNWHEPGSGYPGSAYQYIMSPLPRWEDRDRGHPPEYFSGEYNYYPTPVREGIYRIATDANRLTSIFSEENPNACTIV